MNYFNMLGFLDDLTRNFANSIETPSMRMIRSIEAASADFARQTRGLSGSFAADLVASVEPSRSMLTPLANFIEPLKTAELGIVASTAALQRAIEPHSVVASGVLNSLSSLVAPDPTIAALRGLNDMVDAFTSRAMGSLLFFPRIDRELAEAELLVEGDEEVLDEWKDRIEKAVRLARVPRDHRADVEADLVARVLQHCAHYVSMRRSQGRCWPNVFGSAYSIWHALTVLPPRLDETLSPSELAERVQTWADSAAKRLKRGRIDDGRFGAIEEDSVSDDEPTGLEIVQANELAAATHAELIALDPATRLLFEQFHLEGLPLNAIEIPGLNSSSSKTTRMSRAEARIMRRLIERDLLPKTRDELRLAARAFMALWARR